MMSSNTTRRRTKYVLTGIAALLLAACAAVPFALAAVVMKGKRQTLEEAWTWQSEHYDTSFYDEVEKTEYTVAGFQGYALHAQLLKNPAETDRYVIISHGYTDNRMGALKLIAGAGHAESVLVDKEHYRQYVREFLDTLEK